MPNLMKEIHQRLKGSGQIIVLCVGSDLRSDDIAGLLVAEQLSAKALPKLHVLVGGTAPENQTGEIKRLQPTHLIIVDAADLKATPGTIKLIEVNEVGGYSFSTHALPLKVMVEYLRADLKVEVFIIAIQPQGVAFGAIHSQEIEEAAREVANAIAEASS